MATKSILKDINIKDKKTVAALVNALEHASGKKAQDVKRERSYSEASRAEIKKMFGGSNDRV